MAKQCLKKVLVSLYKCQEQMVDFPKLNKTVCVCVYLYRYKSSLVKHKKYRNTKYRDLHIINLQQKNIQPVA